MITMKNNIAPLKIIDYFTFQRYDEYAKSEQSSTLKCRGGISIVGTECLVIHTTENEMNESIISNKNGRIVREDEQRVIGAGCGGRTGNSDRQFAICVGNGQMHQTDLGGVSGALNCMHDQQAVVTKDNEQSKRHYIVRRLTPTECARLQGFPDDWHTNLINENPSEEEMQFWRKVFDDYCRIFGKKKKTDKQIRKFLATEPSDASIYKMYGNAISIPCANDVLQGIVDLVEEEEEVESKEAK